MKHSKASTGVTIPLRSLRAFPPGTRTADAQKWLRRKGYQLAISRDGLQAVATTQVRSWT